ncbi:neural cell adhesion molecule2 [Biomphalaria pfeifferi]|uniref:Neural cell adhesion molecule2 n=1 Tax=Biomphalaria pfeifferi TaxID=112525 RepID=A0AAD8AQI9_BIOPF|nr:neural cell adhesion molecule2 [Biomphalaria pfeifferi]
MKWRRHFKSKCLLIQQTLGQVGETVGCNNRLWDRSERLWAVTTDSGTSKPMPPSIQPLTSALEGQTLKLSCNTSSRSLPADHGLSSYIRWQDELNAIFTPGDNKYVKNAEDQLEIHNLESSDTGRHVTCASSDKAEGVANPPLSDPSLPYEIRIEGKPSAMNIILTPPTETKIIRRELESLDYTCTANCEPRCTVKWSFKRQGFLIFSPLQPQ